MSHPTSPPATASAPSELVVRAHRFGAVLALLMAAIGAVVIGGWLAGDTRVPALGLPGVTPMRPTGRAQPAAARPRARARAPARSTGRGRGADGRAGGARRRADRRPGAASRPRARGAAHGRLHGHRARAREPGGRDRAPRRRRGGRPATDGRRDLLVALAHRPGPVRDAHVHRDRSRCRGRRTTRRSRRSRGRCCRGWRSARRSCAPMRRRSPRLFGPLRSARIIRRALLVTFLAPLVLTVVVNVLGEWGFWQSEYADAFITAGILVVLLALVLYAGMRLIHAEEHSLWTLDRLLESAERVRELYDDAPTGYLSLNPDGELTEVNATLSEWVGRPGAAMIGRRLVDLATDETRPAVQRAFDALARGRVIEDLDFDLQRDAAEPLAVGLRAEPRIRDDGTLDLVRVTLFDATQQREAQRARRAADARYREIVETANEGIWTLDITGRTTFVNPRVGELLGCAPEELVGRPVTEFLDDDGVALWDQAAAHRDQGRPISAEFRLRAEDGHWLWAQIAGTALRDHEGRGGRIARDDHGHHRAPRGRARRRGQPAPAAAARRREPVRPGDQGPRPAVRARQPRVRRAGRGPAAGARRHARDRRGRVRVGGRDPEASAQRHRGAPVDPRGTAHDHPRRPAGAAQLVLPPPGPRWRAVRGVRHDDGRLRAQGDGAAPGGAQPRPRGARHVAHARAGDGQSRPCELRLDRGARPARPAADHQRLLHDHPRGVRRRGPRAGPALPRPRRPAVPRTCPSSSATC